MTLNNYLPVKKTDSLVEILVQVTPGLIGFSSLQNLVRKDGDHPSNK